MSTFQLSGQKKLAPQCTERVPYCSVLLPPHRDDQLPEGKVVQRLFFTANPIRHSEDVLEDVIYRFGYVELVGFVKSELVNIKIL